MGLCAINAPDLRSLFAVERAQRLAEVATRRFTLVIYVIYVLYSAFDFGFLYTSKSAHSWLPPHTYMQFEIFGKKLFHPLSGRRLRHSRGGQKKRVKTYRQPVEGAGVRARSTLSLSLSLFSTSQKLMVLAQNRESFRSSKYSRSRESLLLEK